MNPILIGLIGLVILILLLFSGMHIGVAMSLVGFVGCWIISGNLNVALGYLKTVPFTTAASFTMSVVPMFILLGQIAYYANISQDLYSACYTLFSRMRGGLAIATEVACAFFAAICGSASATTATMGIVCLPEMDRFKYRRSLSTGAISAGGTLGILIPPSVGFMLYGINAEIAVGKMFMAGLIPGIILAICYSLVVIVICAKDPEAGPAGPKFTMREKLRAVRGVAPILILFVLVLGGIYFGWFTPSEGGAVGAFGAFVFMFIRKKASFANIIRVLKDTAGTTAMIFLIMIGAYLLGYFLTLSQLPTAFATWAANAQVNRYWILLLALGVYAVLGCFVDSLPLIVLLVPIFLPVMKSLGFDPIWFGVLMVMDMQLGLITPPVGACCYIMAGVAKDTPLSTIFKGTAPFIIGLLVAMAIVIAFPVLSTWLPSMM